MMNEVQTNVVTTINEIPTKRKVLSYYERTSSTSRVFIHFSRAIFIEKLAAKQSVRPTAPKPNQSNGTSTQGHGTELDTH